NDGVTGGREGLLTLGATRRRRADGRHLETRGYPDIRQLDRTARTRRSRRVDYALSDRLPPRSEFAHPVLGRGNSETRLVLLPPLSPRRFAPRGGWCQRGWSPRYTGKRLGLWKHARCSRPSCSTGR